MCPEVFGLTPLTSRAQLLNPDQEVTEDVRRAAAFCPKKCILVSGEDIDA
jgi:ferredoxin